MATYPNWRDKAITLSLPSGDGFQFPHNPVDLAEQSQALFTQRPTMDGWVTINWRNKPRVYTHAGFTGSEGGDPWFAARDRFLGLEAHYDDALTGASTQVLVTRFDVTGNGQHPATFRWAIDCVAVQQYRRPTN